MTNYELIDRMRELLNEPNYYGSGGNNWSSYVYNGWYVDCTCSIKAILWGGRFTPANRNKAHAGCVYGSNNVPDFTPQSCVQWTNAQRGNFQNLVPGEILLMTSQSHAGLYIGNNEVIEVTPAWTGGKPGCQISKIGPNGERIKNGVQVLSWEYHGKIPVVQYVNTNSNKFEGVSDEELARRVWNGEFGNGQDRMNALGNRFNNVQALVDKGVGKPTEIVKDKFEGVSDEELAKRVWSGEFGNGQDRINALGDRFNNVQALVDRGIGKPIDESNTVVEETPDIIQECDHETLINKLQNEISEYKNIIQSKDDVINELLDFKESLKEFKPNIETKTVFYIELKPGDILYKQ